MTKSKFKDFDVKQVPLEGNNIVEAGAGTGKTYSIAILALRLLLEKEFSVKEILMVTFTKAATAELESRIREFIRISYNYASSNEVEDTVIKDIIDQYNNKPKAKALLGKALFELDETSIFTIHSFCQKTLTEFAFETGQIFGAEGLEDLSGLINDEVNNYWRNEVSKIDAQLLGVLRICKYQGNKVWPKYLTREGINAVVNNTVSGKEFKADTLNINTFAEYENAETAIDNQIIGLVNANKASYITRINNHTGNRYTDNAKAKLIERLNDPLEFAAHIVKTNAENDNLIFAAEKEMFSRYRAEKKTIPIRIINSVFKNAADEISPRITAELKARNQISFDKMIQSLHKASLNTKLKNLLQKRYPAVFIDEFQDTDKFQYEIFETFFNSASVVFYIGDPKQAIYAWRKADINSYFTAREGVKERYNMKMNFRSNVKLVKAFNKFFEPTNDFDPFCNDSSDAEKRIEYTDVIANSGKAQKEVTIDKASIEPIRVLTELKDQGEINKAVCDTVSLLLSKGELGGQAIKPYNIAILARTNREAQGLKQILESKSIPAIVMSDEKIFSSPEAKQLLYFLEAITSISIKNIARALLCPFTGFDSKKIVNLDPDVNVSFFKAYLDILKKDGIYACVLRFTADYKIKENLLNGYVQGGQRKLSNLLQLAEELQLVQNNKGLDETELLSFLKKAIGGMEIEGESYVQRIESDNDALTIITVHKSKGLEYDIVLIPFMDMTVRPRGAFTSYRNDASNSYEFTTNEGIDQVALNYFKTQANQENSRLIYVAITRAKYQCFIFLKKDDKKKSALSPYIDALRAKSGLEGLILIVEFEPSNEEYQPEPINYSYNYPEVNNFDLKDKNWSKMSYSALSGEHRSSPKTSSKIYATEYDKFIFGELERGTNAGEFLHSVFEWIDFTDPERWPSVIEKSINRYLQGKSEFKKPMNEFLNTVLNTEMEVNGEKLTLKNVTDSHKCNELEFDINLNEFQVSELADLADETTEIHTTNAGKLYGVLNGKMDLFFEYNGKYYILDWKSNYLGDDLNDYTPDKLNEAMNENNYHLQYLIYTYAAKKFLESKLQGFDYERQFGGVIYLFLRGVRSKSNSGVFTKKPSLELINRLDIILSKSRLCSGSESKG